MSFIHLTESKVHRAQSRDGRKGRGFQTVTAEGAGSLTLRIKCIFFFGPKAHDRYLLARCATKPQTVTREMTKAGSGPLHQE